MWEINRWPGEAFYLGGFRVTVHAVRSNGIRLRITPAPDGPPPLYSAPESAGVQTPSPRRQLDPLGEPDGGVEIGWPLGLDDDGPGSPA